MNLNRVALRPSYLARQHNERESLALARLPAPPRLCAAERALRDAIVAAPDADKLRLVYADWLDRNGDPVRAEFVRLQIELCRRNNDDLRVREEQLLNLHEATWLAELAPWSVAECRFHRGFVEGATLTGRAFISRATGLFEMAPIRYVRLIAIAPFMEELARTPHLERLEGLDLADARIGDGGLRSLLRSPHIGGLKQLNLRACDITDPFTWAGLEHLDVSDNKLGPAAAGLAAGTVSRLELNRVGLGDSGMRLLVQSEIASEIRRLGLAGNEIGMLPDIEAFPNLESLNLAFNPVPAARFALARLSPKLRTLDLSHCDLNDAIPEPPFGLEEMRLAGNRLSDRTLDAFSRRESSNGIRGLDLTANCLGNGVVAAISRFPNLRELVLSNNALTESGVADLAALPSLAQIRVLSLSWNHLGDAAATALARSQFTSGLRQLDLSGNDIGVAGARALSESPYLGQLRRLILKSNPRLWDSAVARLRERFGAALQVSAVSR